MLKSAREAHSSKMAALEESVSSLTGQLEANDSELSRLQWQWQDNLKQKQGEIDQ